MGYRVAILLLSAATLAYQIALMRVFSISQWHHFAYMVISIALLGFGASGTFLTFARARLLAHFPAAFTTFSALFALSLPAAFWLAQRIPFDPFLIVWDTRQYLYLGGYYLVLFVPFFCAASAIGLALVYWARMATRVYFVNLVGSGLGSLALVVFLYWVPAEQTITLIYVFAATATLLVLPALGVRARVLLVLLLVGAFYLLLGADVLALRISQYKGLSVNLNLPNAEIIARDSSPLGRLDVLRSAAFHHAPGLSFAARVTPPAQHGLFVDGELAGALTRFAGDIAAATFLDGASAALPYHLLATSLRPYGRGSPRTPVGAQSREERPPEAGVRPRRMCLGHTPGAQVLVLGAGGGADVLLALYHDAAAIEAVELDPRVLRLVRDTFADFTGGLYRLPRVRLHAREARGFFEALPAGKRYDLIQVSLVESFAASSAGVHALNESYLYTVEAFARYFDHLTPDGVVAITRWVKMPPRDNIKVFATAVAALEARGVGEPARHVAMIRSWSTATTLIRRTPLTGAEIAALKKFAHERLFDLVSYPGIGPDETNRYTLLEREYYAEAARAILVGGEERERFFRDYSFNVRPARDDRPYFHHFFRWKALPQLLATMGRQWVPFIEWGYMVLVATLAQALVFSLVLILLPLAFLRRGPATASPSESSSSRGGTFRVFLFFLAIGLGFLFIEMMLIQKFTFFLANPIYAVAVVLTGVLVFSGFGSLAAGRLGVGWLERAATLVAALALLAAYALPRLLPLWVGLGDAARVAIALALMAPLAFFMGMPFPLALQRLSAARPELLPWAWGVNGCASVLATILATLLAMAAGFRVVFVTAAALYLLAAISFRDER
ncbi:MAG: SAM-dependent methyltransferase [Terriglobia bacterium]